MVRPREEQEFLTARVARHFRRPEVRATAIAYLTTLLERSVKPRAKAVTANARALPATRIARLLRTARWDESALRDELREYVVERFGDDRAILALREESFSWRGREVVGVARQYVARTLRWRHCQLGLFLAYLAPGGVAFLDRELYVPREWVADEELRQRAGIPAGTSFASKGELGVAMLQRAYLAAVPATWVVAERAYTVDPTLLSWLNGVDVPYLLEVSSIWSPTQPQSGEPGADQGIRLRFETVADNDWWRIPDAVTTVATTMEWAQLSMPAPLAPSAVGSREWLLAARPAGHRGRTKYYVARTPVASTVSDIVAVASRSAALDALVSDARAVGLGEYRTRAWRGWYRHATLALLAQGYRAVSASPMASP